MGSVARNLVFALTRSPGLFLGVFVWMLSGAATPAHAGWDWAGAFLDLILGPGLGTASCDGEDYEGSDGGVGSILCNVIVSSETLPGAINGLAYMFAIWLAFFGILKLKDHVENPNQTTVWEPMKRILAAGALFAFPFVAEVFRNTISGDGDATELDGYTMTGFSGDSFWSGGLDSMLIGLMSDLWAPMQSLITNFAYMAGLVLTFIAIMRLMKSTQDGPRGPGGFGTIMTILTAGILFSLPGMMGVFSTSLFGTSDIVTSAELCFGDVLLCGLGIDPAMEHAQAVLSSVLAFMILIGWISFVRGWFIIREVAEGDSHASLMAGLTHVFGGALAVNLGPLINAVTTTFGISGFSVTFS